MISTNSSRVFPATRGFTRRSSPMLVQLWRGARRAIGWVIAGVVALVASWLLPGWWFIVVGAIVGSIAGGFIDERD